MTPKTLTLRPKNAALKNRTERLGKDHVSTAKASRSLGIIKYLHRSFAESRIYLEDFVRVSEAQAIMDDIDYVLSLLLLGEVNYAESRFDDAQRYWTKAKHMLEEYPACDEKMPQLGEMLQHRLEKAQKGSAESKSLFSRFTELARFEDEVSAEVPVEEKLQEIIRSYTFFDDQ